MNGELIPIFHSEVFGLICPSGVVEAPGYFPVVKTFHCQLKGHFQLQKKEVRKGGEVWKGVSGQEGALFQLAPVFSQGTSNWHGAMFLPDPGCSEKRTSGVIADQLGVPVLQQDLSLQSRWDE